MTVSIPTLIRIVDAWIEHGEPTDPALRRDFHLCLAANLRAVEREFREFDGLVLSHFREMDRAQRRANRSRRKLSEWIDRHERSIGDGKDKA